MRLKHVRIHSNLTAKQAETIINQWIAEANEDGLEMNFEILIENSVAVNGFYDTRYTLIIHEYEILEGYNDAGD